MKKCVFACVLFSCVNLAVAEPPKLVVQIVVDQLRSDILGRYQAHFSKGGFNRILAHGIDYRNASHDHANTVTCVGHATISTGAPPAYHGIVANKWYDDETGKQTYCVFDPDYPLLSRPSNKKAGRSPKWLTTSTLTDEWHLANKGLAYAVSLKDRSAIMLAGHSGKAFWFDKQLGQVTSSSYYFSKLPAWAEQWNSTHPAQAYQWDMSHPKNFYFNHKAARFKNRFPDFNAEFPHFTGSSKGRSYHKFFSMTPLADKRTNQFALTLLKTARLGQHPNQTDYLAISFSGNDAIGHQFGPNSIECEDNLYQLDKEIEKLLNQIDKQVGLNHTLILLTADHGVKDSHVDLKRHHIRVDDQTETEQVRQMIFRSLKDKWQLDESAISSIQLPYVYFNHRIIAEKKLDMAEVKAGIAAQLNGSAPVFRAIPMPFHQAANDELDVLVDAMSIPNRSGDLYLVPFPNHTLKPYEEARVMHGSPWQNDRSVPLIVSQGNWSRQIVYRPISTLDIAPTLSLLVAIKKPASSTGKPLLEVLKRFNKDT